MAAETTQTGQAPSAGGETPAGAAPAKAGGLSSYLPLIIAIVVMPVAAYVTVLYKTKGSSKPSTTSHEGEPAEDAPASHEAKAPDAHAAPPAHGAAAADAHGNKGKTPVKTGKRNTKLPVPLTREAVVYVERAKAGDVDKISTLDMKGEPKDLAQSDKIVVNVAGTGGTRYVLARLSFVSEWPDFLERLNENRERLIAVVSETLSSKTLEDLNKNNSRAFLKAELLGLLNQQLGSTMIQDVVIHEFVIQ